ncbi:MAG: Peptide chain release factor subunit 1 [Candidatus Heimdallarchaeota archaeon LC_3]|nr:MAG: Peptide chain release factor subunit 1 [Candidatus Heimdallarchaeota archaeon LC_3]
MRLVRENHKQNSKTIIPESLTDIFILKNLIDPNDIITSKTHRRIRKKGIVGREGDKGERITLTLSIQVIETNFQESEVDNRLRIKGIITEGPEEHISLGSSHTINIVVNQSITIKKTEWGLHHQKYLEESIKATKLSPICLMAIDRGDATITILDNFKLNVIANISYQLPGKQADQKFREKSEKIFFKRLFEILKFQVVKLTNIFIIGGPGNVKKRFFDFLSDNWSLENKRIHLENISSGTMSGINEIMNRDILNQIAADYQYLKIETFIEEFILRLATNPNKISYGIDDIVSVLEIGAAETILISDRYFRANDEPIKNKLKNIMELIKQTNSDLILVDYNSSPGKKIEQFGKIIALLRFEMYSEYDNEI